MGAEAELEGDAAEDQGEEHDNERHVEGRQQRRVAHREDGEEQRAAEHEPSLVAVPDRRDRAHHGVAVGVVWREGEEDAEAEIEAVHHHVEGDPESEHEGEEQRQVEAHRASSLSPSGAARSIPVRPRGNPRCIMRMPYSFPPGARGRTGRCESRESKPGLSSSGRSGFSVSTGPRNTMRAAYQKNAASSTR